MRYNFACALSVHLKETDTALDMLEPVLAKFAGSFLHHAKVDPDLDPLREDPRFKAMLAAAEARIARAADAVRAAHLVLTARASRRVMSVRVTDRAGSDRGIEISIEQLRRDAAARSLFRPTTRGRDSRLETRTQLLLAAQRQTLRSHCVGGSAPAALGRRPTDDRGAISDRR